MKTKLGHYEQFGNFSEEDKITTINFVYVVSVENYKMYSVIPLEGHF